jgi:hypothetical protein
VNLEVMGVIFEGIDGLMPVGRKDIASSTGEALIYLGKRVVLGHEIMHSWGAMRLTFAHGPEYRSFCGTYPDADSYKGENGAQICQNCKAGHTAALAPG